MTNVLESLQAERARLADSMARLDTAIGVLEGLEPRQTAQIPLPIVVHPPAARIPQTTAERTFRKISKKGDTKEQVIRILSEHRSGLTYAEIAARITGIPRTDAAVHRAIADLELRGKHAFERVEVASPNSKYPRHIVALKSPIRTEAHA